MLSPDSVDPLKFVIACPDTINYLFLANENNDFRIGISEIIKLQEEENKGRTSVVIDSEHVDFTFKNLKPFHDYESNFFIYEILYKTIVAFTSSLSFILITLQCCFPIIDGRRQSCFETTTGTPEEVEKPTEKQEKSREKMKTTSETAKYLNIEDL